jgi:hypothetical protein
MIARFLSRRKDGNQAVHAGIGRALPFRDIFANSHFRRHAALCALIREITKALSEVQAPDRVVSTQPPDRRGFSRPNKPDPPDP